MKKNIIYLVALLSIVFYLTGCGSNTTIKFETNDPNVKVESIKEKPGTKISSPSNVTKEGYRLDGWNLDGTLYVFDVMPEEDITLEAIWTKLYYITFNLGDEKDVQGYAENEGISYPTPTKSGYKLINWELDGEVFNKTKMIAQDIELKAIWEETVTVYFDTGIDGEVLEPVTGVPGEKVLYPYMPTKEGYRFSGWMLNYQPYTLHSIPDEDIRLTAIWEETAYTNFPALYINLYDTNWKTIDIESVGKEDYENAIISLENTETGELQYSGAQFRGRGNGSWNSTKKGYRIKFDEKQSLFGEAESRHWVILACYSGDFQDNTMMRNALAYQMGDLFDNIDYCTSANWVDVYFNNSYYGTYLLVEQVRDANDRVDVDAEYGVLDTGYLIEYDAYATRDNAIIGVDYFTITGVKYGFTMKSPASDEYLENGITEAQYREQVSWLKNQVQSMYSAALSKNFNEFSKYADVDSFVDMYILHELFKNTDAGWSSFYISKRAGEKFEANCPWDFDATAGISRGDSSYEGIYVADKVQQLSNNTSSELFIALYNTSQFKELIVLRWKELAPKLEDFIKVNYSVDNLSLMKEGMGRNYRTWCGNYSQSAAENKWLQEAQSLTTWLLNRIDWLSNEWV